MLSIDTNWSNWDNRTKYKSKYLEKSDTAQQNVRNIHGAF